jgi:hypothetical protein
MRMQWLMVCLMYVQCMTGTYQSSSKQSSCQSCPAGYYLPVGTDRNDISLCQPCSAGFFAVSLYSCLLFLYVYDLSLYVSLINTHVTLYLSVNGVGLIYVLVRSLYLFPLIDWHQCNIMYGMCGRYICPFNSSIVVYQLLSRNVSNSIQIEC